MSARMLEFLYRRFLLTITVSILMLAPFFLYCLDAQAGDESENNVESVDSPLFIKQVTFKPGEYLQEEPGQITQVVEILKSLPPHTHIRLIGQSQSRKSLASEKLALLRAKTVKKKLVAHGIAAKHITLDAEVINFKAQGQLAHGTMLIAMALQESAENKLTKADKPTVNQSPEKKSPVTPHNSQANTEAASKLTEENYLKDQDVYPCTQVIINTGSLKANLEREIGECGYVMGSWKFGSEDELIDWYIPVEYFTTVDNGIVGLLQLVENNYQIRAHVHQLDKSIDFFPSVKDRGGYE